MKRYEARERERVEQIKVLKKEIHRFQRVHTTRTRSTYHAATGT